MPRSHRGHAEAMPRPHRDHTEITPHLPQVCWARLKAGEQSPFHDLASSCDVQLANNGAKEFYECGPMKQLKAMMRRIDQTAWKATENIAVQRS